MGLPTPNLDDRTFQQLVNDAKRMVQERCPEWTDHNVSDPGVTLIETFAYMVDQLLYRVNRIPERNYLRFLDLIGVRPFPAQAARTQLTFWLSAPQPTPVVVPAGTEASTARIPTEDPVVFSTVRDLTIVPRTLRSVFAQRAAGSFEAMLPGLVSGREQSCFSDVPESGDCLLIGLDEAAPDAVVAFRFGCSERGIGIDTQFPPLVWEAWDGNGWTACEWYRDGTGGLNLSGDVVVSVPAVHVTSIENGERAGWLRARVVDPVEDQRSYAASPAITSLAAMTVGANVEAVNASIVTNEVLGVSTGVPGQRFPLQNGPAAASQDAAVLEVSVHDELQQWNPVPSFGDSDATSQHFILDEQSGSVELGPVVRMDDGTLKQYGAVPPTNAILRLSAYRVGGGQRGNVSAGAICVLKQPIPYIRTVENLSPGIGGVDAETVTEAAVRGPLVLRTFNRAVTTRDYEHLAHQVAPEVARVRCVPAGRAGDGASGRGVRVLVVPRCTPDDNGRVPFHQLVPEERTLERIGRYLDERRLVGDRVIVEPPRYQGITVVARVRANRRANPDEVERACIKALYTYYDPFSGGPSGEGWPFGRTISEGEAYAVLQQVPGVDYVDETRLFAADPITGQRGDEVDRIELDANSLVFSYEHLLRVRAAV